MAVKKKKNKSQLEQAMERQLNKEGKSFEEWANQIVEPALLEFLQRKGEGYENWRKSLLEKEMISYLVKKLDVTNENKGVY